MGPVLVFIFLAQTYIAYVKTRRGSYEITFVETSYQSEPV
jgi:hypothetical protein